MPWDIYWILLLFCLLSTLCETFMLCQWNLSFERAGEGTTTGCVQVSVLGLLLQSELCTIWLIFHSTTLPVDIEMLQCEGESKWGRNGKLFMCGYPFNFLPFYFGALVQLDVWHGFWNSTCYSECKAIQCWKSLLGTSFHQKKCGDRCSTELPKFPLSS